MVEFLLSGMPRLMESERAIVKSISEGWLSKISRGNKEVSSVMVHVKVSRKGKGSSRYEVHVHVRLGKTALPPCTAEGFDLEKVIHQGWSEAKNLAGHKSKSK